LIIATPEPVMSRVFGRGGGHEQLPTFNSLAIETMLWRIEGLADRFLYFNDDMMPVGPVKPADFFSRVGKSQPSRPLDQSDGAT